MQPFKVFFLKPQKLQQDRGHYEQCSSSTSTLELCSSVVFSFFLIDDAAAHKSALVESAYERNENIKRTKLLTAR